MEFTYPREVLVKLKELVDSGMVEGIECTKTDMYTSMNKEGLELTRLKSLSLMVMIMETKKEIKYPPKLEHLTLKSMGDKYIPYVLNLPKSLKILTFDGLSISAKHF